MNQISQYFEGEMALSHPQARIWLTERIQGATAMHNVGGLLRVRGDLNLDILEGAIKMVVENNPILRYGFRERLGVPYQYEDPTLTPKIERCDFSGEPNPHAAFMNHCKLLMHTPFSLNEGALCHFMTYRCGPNLSGLYVMYHHIIGDGWASQVLLDQISQYYDFLIGEGTDRPKTPPQYLNYLEKEKAYFESKRFEKDREYWKEMFTPLPTATLEIPLEDMRANRHSLLIPQDQVDAIDGFCQSKGVTPAALMILIQALYQRELKQENTVVIGVPVLNRTGQEKKTFGMYTSSMALRFDFSNDMRILDGLANVKQVLTEALHHQKYPYDLLVRDLDLRRNGFSSLFETAVNLYVTDYQQTLGGFPVDTMQVSPSHQSYALQWVYETVAMGTYLHIDYQVARYSEQVITGMGQGFNNILRTVLGCSETTTIDEVGLISPEVLTTQLCLFNATSDPSLPKTLPFEAFAHHARQSPQAIALYCDTPRGANGASRPTMSYGDLAEAVEACALHYKALGLGRGHYVGLIQGHSPHLIVHMLACLKLAIVYVPIEPNYPPGRIRYMLETVGAKWLVADGAAPSSTLSEIGWPCLEATAYLDQEQAPGTLGPLEAHSSDPAYCIFTSGSSGRPKGVLISHGNLGHYAAWAARHYLIKPRSIFACYSSIAFDLTITSIWAPLVSGNALALYEDDGQFPLHRVFKENLAHVVKLTPSHLQASRGYMGQNTAVEVFVVGGENLTTQLCSDVLDEFQREVRIFNEYGPTETTVGCMRYVYGRADGISSRSVPIGVPAENTQLYIIGATGKILGPGMTGELHIGGRGVGIGYVNNVVLTDQAFIEMNVPGEGLTRLYRTGDLVHWRHDGQMVFVGRKDHQTKVNGYRIELEEIRLTLLEQPSISDAYVQVVEMGSGQVAHSKRLVAYVVVSQDIDQGLDQGFDHEACVKALRLHLPHYMVPTKIIPLETMPLTISGKVDTSLLPTDFLRVEEGKRAEVEVDVDVDVDYHDQATQCFIEHVRSVLCVPGARIGDNFFDLGGDSIKAIQITARLQESGYGLSVNDLLSSSSLADAALCIVTKSLETTADQGPLEGAIETLPIVDWFFTQPFNEPHYFHQSATLKLSSPVAPEILEGALKYLIAYHDMLRVQVTEDQQLSIGPVACAEAFELLVLDTEGETAPTEILRHLRQSISLTSGIALKALYHTNSRGQNLYLVAHHLGVDGVSWRIIFEDLNRLIVAAQNGQALTLPRKSHSYHQYARAVNHYKGQVPKAHISYWEALQVAQQTHGVHPFLGKDMTIFKEIGCKTLKTQLDSRALQAIKDGLRMEIQEVLTGAMAIAMWENRHVLGTLIEMEHHGRLELPGCDVGRTVGWFTTLYPIYVPSLWDQEDKLEALLPQIKENLRGIPNHGFDYSLLPQVNQLLEPAVRFNYLGDFTGEAAAGANENVDTKLNTHPNLSLSLTLSPSEINDSSPLNVATAPFEFNVVRLGDQLMIQYVVDTSLVHQETVQGFIDRYDALVGQIITHATTAETTGDIQFVPSDFGDWGILQEDLDSLFEG